MPPHIKVNRILKNSTKHTEIRIDDMLSKVSMTQQHLDILCTLTQGLKCAYNE